MTKLKAPAAMAYSRKINPTNALMFSTDWNNKSDVAPVMVGTKTVFGTQSIRNKPKLADKGNIQSVNFANLPNNKDTLLVEYNVKFLGDIFSTCLGGGEYVTKLTDALKGTEMDTLAYRYVYNLVAARALWRNRVGAEEVETVLTVEGVEYRFDSLDFPLNDLEDSVDEVMLISKKVVGALDSVDSFINTKVQHYVLLGDGSEVYPSQEFVENKLLSKQLFDINGQAAFHDQKVGNAIRTVDTWYEGAGKPIAVEPFGSLVREDKAVRTSNKDNLFSLMDTAVNGGDLSQEDKLFIIANLIRGGVFGGK